jgi:hypothetical protein
MAQKAKTRDIQNTEISVEEEHPNIIKMLISPSSLRAPFY